MSKAFVSNELIIKEGALTTKIWKAQGLDLVVEQIFPDGTKAYLRHTSNPGTCFFASLLKFLHAQKIPIPKTKAPRKQTSEFVENAVGAANFAVHAKYPYTYPYAYTPGMEAPARVTIRPGINQQKQVVLNFDLGGKTITIAPRTAQWLIRKIPQIYPNEPAFHAAFAEFTLQAKKIKQKKPLIIRAIKPRRRVLIKRKRR